MVKMKKWGIWIVIGILIIVSIFWYVKSRAPKTTYTTANVEKGDLAQTVSVTGDLIADEEITLNFEIGGRVSRVFVKESNKVAAGDKIATLTDEILQKQVDQAKAALDRTIAQAGLSDDSLREAKVAVDNAEDTLDKTKDLNDENLEAASRAVDNAQNYLDAVQDYYNDNVSKLNKLTLTTAQNSLETAKQSKKVAEQQAELSETSAENSLDIAKARQKSVESKYTEDSNDASVAGARAAYDMAVLGMAKATLISPVNGIITEINNKPGEVLGTGVIKESFSRVMSLDMIIESKIPESDIVKVKLGQRAKVTLDALTADDVFEGEVVEIDPASTTIQDVVYYRIKLKLNNVDARVKPGMSANIDVETTKKTEVLKVPMRAIKTEGSRKYVDVLLENDITRKTYVETGLEGDEGMVEVKSGLDVGEKVVTFVTTK